MFQCDCPPDDCADKVRRYLEGDRAAGDELANKFQRLVRSIVQRVLGAERRAEHDDACQAVFLRVFANLKRWEQRCPFCKWLAVVAARRAIDVTRLHETEPTLEAMEQVPDTRCASRLDEETIQSIQRIVARFPDRWQRVWKMWSEGVSREQMAKELGKSVRTVQYWLAEMLEQIREHLSD